MKGRLFIILLFCLMVDGAMVEPNSLAQKEDGKYGHMIFDRIDKVAKAKLPEKGYEAFDESFTVIAKPKETIQKARDQLITDEDSQAAKIADKVLSKFFLITIIVGTGFGLFIKIAIWAMSS